MIEVGIAGASGYTGAELMRLLASHPEMRVRTVQAQSHAGALVSDLYPSLAAAYPDMAYGPLAPEVLAQLDCVFLALPHGTSEAVAVSILGAGSWGGVLVDLSADFRLRDPVLYEKWYGRVHGAPDLLEGFAYGLPELNRERLAETSLVAVPGCYPTAAILAMLPFVEEGLAGDGPLIVDATSGVSGAGRGLSDTTHFGSANESFSAYSPLEHRHTPEMEQALGREVVFTPHLAPMSRGILATCHAELRIREGFDTAAALELMAKRYTCEPFVQVSEGLPGTKSVTGSNCARLSARVGARSSQLVAFCAIDNLVKGASGGAVQCANIALGLAEETGLPRASVYP